MPMIRIRKCLAQEKFFSANKIMLILISQTDDEKDDFYILNFF